MGFGFKREEKRMESALEREINKTYKNGSSSVQREQRTKAE